jgi:maltooligosyltrehalose trehalohydrolase
MVNDSGEEKGYYADFGSMADLAKALEKAFVYDGIYSRYRMNVHGRPVQGLSAHRFLGYIQNHDQVGNRAVGDRVEAIVGMDRAKIAAAIVMMAPFIPMVFQGEEFAASTPFQYFADHEDPEMAKAVKEGRRGEFAAFGWRPEDIPDPEKKETFERSKLRWDEIHEGRHEEMLEWYRRLIRLRRGTASLNDGDMSRVKVKFNAAARWLTMERGAVEVFCNLGRAVAEFDRKPGYAVAMVSREDVVVTPGKIMLPPDSAIILSGEKLSQVEPD